MASERNEHNLDDLRTQIDALDAELISLLNKRMAIAKQVGQTKRTTPGHTHMPFDAKREEDLFHKILAHNTSQAHPMPEATLRSIYREILSGSYAQQKQLKIAYLGPHGTFTEQAALKAFGSSVQHEPLRTIEDVFETLERGEVDYGVIPIENSTEGAVGNAVDSLASTNMKILNELEVPINHCLISATPLELITYVYSKDQALGQCRSWLRRHLPHASLTTAASTVEAIEKASDPGSGVAVIGSALAAERYGVPLRAENIQDTTSNKTRFIVLGPEMKTEALGAGRDKTSLIVSLPHSSGSIARALEPFSKRGLNLTQIHSHPLRKEGWEYVFFIDFIGHQSDPVCAEALAELRAFCPEVKWLGSYPRAA